MKKAILLGLVCILICSSCSKEAIIRRKEDKLIGAWQFEKAFYKKDGAIFRDNVIREYANDVIEFYPDYTASYDDYSLRSIFQGDWSLIVDEDDAFDHSSTDLEFFVDAVFFDFLNREDFFIFGSIDKLNRNKLNLESSDRYGSYTFKLERL